MTDGLSSRACYTKLNFDFPYVRFLSLRRNTYTLCAVGQWPKYVKSTFVAIDLFM